MGFHVCLYASLVIFCLGLSYKICQWFRFCVDGLQRKAGPAHRLYNALRGTVAALLGPRSFILLKAFLLDILLQQKILKESLWRWIMHMLLFWGVILLVFMHAMDQFVTASLFSHYEPTRNPYFFLRDLFGVMVIAGIGMAVCRRFITAVPRLRTDRKDKYAIILLAVIIFSGFFLTGAKILSKTAFSRMVDTYAGLRGQPALALESYWVSREGLVSPEIAAPFRKDRLEQGKRLHEQYCAGCHAPAQSAFTSYALAKLLRPIAVGLKHADLAQIFWYMHFCSCFLGLACLPFSKMFHIFSTPICILCNAVMDEEAAAPENIATRQAIEIDACTHCCSCSIYCSAMMAYEAKKNSYILPSEKIAAIKSVAAGKKIDETVKKEVLEGVYLCTNCDRCTAICPSGINLRQLWTKAREKLLQQGPAEPCIFSQLSFARALNRKRIPAGLYPFPLEKADRALRKKFEPLLDSNRHIELDPPAPANASPFFAKGTFAYCFGCQNCSAVCPVVGNYEKPEEQLGLLPHQIMSCLGLGLSETVLGAKMIWNCLTCYQCQEHCPQNVEVADILYELKYMAIDRMDGGRENAGPGRGALPK